MHLVLRSGMGRISGLILPFVAACLALGLAGCGGGGGSGGATPPTLIVIAITPASASVVKGATASLTATGTYSDGSTTDITSQVTWASADASTASVGANTGVVTGVANGITTVTAALSNVTSPAATITVPYDFYVEAGWGNDASNCAVYPIPAYSSDSPWGDGTTSRPFGTITCALAAAKEKVTATGVAVSVKVLPGISNNANGETFPLVLSSKVSLVGDAANKGAPAIGAATEINGSATCPAISGGNYVNAQAQICTVYVPPAASDVTISGFKIPSGSTSILADAATSLTIADSTLAGSNVTDTGIFLVNGTTATVTGNVITGGQPVLAEDIPTSVKLRGNSLNATQAGYGVATTTGSTIDLGTAADPGNNLLSTFGGNQYGLVVFGVGAPTIYNAVGNTWKANIATGVAVTDAQGQQTVASVTGPYSDVNLWIPSGVTVNFQVE